MSSEWDLVPFAPEHLQQIKRVDPGALPAFDASSLGQAGPAFTVMLDGDPVSAGGLIDMGFGRAHAWAWMGTCPTKSFIRLHRIVLAGLDRIEFRRVEMVVREHYECGCRWAELLGFTCECRYLRSYFPDGSAGSLYARTR